MRELSLHLLDLAQNAAAAVAGMPGARVSIGLVWDGRQGGADCRSKRPEEAPLPCLTLCVADNGRGMTARQAQKAQSPFYTTRAARGAGLGIPLCKAAALRTGGAFSLQSAPGAGTRVTASFCTGHIDCAPLGDLPETLAAVVGGSPEIAFTVSARMRLPAREALCVVQDAAFLAEESALRALTREFAPGDARAFLRLKQYFQEKLSPFLQKGEQNMKSLEELAAIRDKMKQTVETRGAAHDATRVTVGMGTGGIAAGARAVLNAFAEEVGKSGLHGVLVTQSGSIGPAGWEPVVEVVCAGAQPVTYVKMTPEKAARVVAEHLAGGTPVAEYNVENAQ